LTPSVPFSSNRPHTLFTVFFGMRLLTDVMSSFRQNDPSRPPGWLSRWFKDRAQFEAKWQTDRAQLLKNLAADEEEFDGRPSAHALPGAEA
jgi:hypothetical protein